MCTGLVRSLFTDERSVFLGELELAQDVLNYLVPDEEEEAYFMNLAMDECSDEHDVESEPSA